MTMNSIEQEKKDDGFVEVDELFAQRRTYNIVSNSKRQELIALLQSKMSIKNAAIEAGINYENAKAIYRTYRLQDRKRKIGKRSQRFNGSHAATSSEKQEFFLVHTRSRRPRGSPALEETDSITANDEAVVDADGYDDDDDDDDNG